VHSRQRLPGELVRFSRRSVHVQPAHSSQLAARSSSCRWVVATQRCATACHRRRWTQSLWLSLCVQPPLLAPTSTTGSNLHHWLQPLAPTTGWLQRRYRSYSYARDAREVQGAVLLLATETRYSTTKYVDSSGMSTAALPYRTKVPGTYVQYSTVDGTTGATDLSRVDLS
jgi:hypothetical protein